MAEDRARSFIERYVIARAPHFRVGFEQEDAFDAALTGKTVYRNINNVAKDAEPDPFVSAGLPGSMAAGSATLRNTSWAPTAQTPAPTVQVAPPRPPSPRISMHSVFHALGLK